MHSDLRLDATLAAPAFPATADRPRRPRHNVGPEGPWWTRPVRPQ